MIERESRRRQEQDSVGERQPVPAGVQLAGQVTVLRQHRTQHREPVERGVGRQHQDEGGHRGDQQEPDVEAAEHRLRQLGDQGLLHSSLPGRRSAGFAGSSTSLTPICSAQHDDAHQQGHRDRAQHQQGRCGVARLGFLKRRHPVADRLDTGQRRAARGERPRHQERQSETDDV